ncbi:MAG: HAD-IIIA family hydrolase [Opitutaceae bacterium]|nr:HAD-IIIA family hydrolase [Opitutaceae bacterium]
MAITQAVILCGGRGSRLGSIAGELPKPMVVAGGRPVLDHVIAALAAGGVRRFLLAAGYRGQVIGAHYAAGANTPVDCVVETVIETEVLGTAGAVASLVGRLDEDFVVAYGDVFPDFDVAALLRAHEEVRGAGQAPVGTLLVRASDHPWDSDLIVLDEVARGRVREFVHRHEPGRLYRNVANAAVYVLARRAVECLLPGQVADFGRDVFPALLARGEVLRTHELESGGFVKDMGTPERLAAVEEYLAERAAAALARANPGLVTTVLLDRDGVLNDEAAGLVDTPEKLVLLPGAAEAVALLNRAGMRCIVVTNQSVVARGLCTEGTLAAIHARLSEAIAAEGGGARIEAVLYCPHHPETHHGEGVAELRRACRCRKPQPGLIFRAWRELGIELAGAVVVGNRASDVRAGRAAGLRTVLVGPAGRRERERTEVAPDLEYDSLLAFARAVKEGALLPRA